MIVLINSFKNSNSTLVVAGYQYEEYINYLIADRNLRYHYSDSKTYFREIKETELIIYDLGLGDRIYRDRLISLSTLGKNTLLLTGIISQKRQLEIASWLSNGYDRTYVFNSQSKNWFEYSFSLSQQEILEQLLIKIVVNKKKPLLVTTKDSLGKWRKLLVKHRIDCPIEEMGKVGFMQLKSHATIIGDLHHSCFIKSENQWILFKKVDFKIEKIQEIVAWKIMQSFNRVRYFWLF